MTARDNISGKVYFTFVLLALSLACHQNPDKRELESVSSVQPVEPNVEMSAPAPAPIRKETPKTSQKIVEDVTTQIEKAEHPDEKKESKKKSKKIKDDPIAKIKGDILEELSGITPAARRGEYWGHNDRGNDPKLHRFNLDEKILQSVALQGVENDDWEAVCRMEDGSILIGGFGDNDENRSQYHIYRCSEPNRGDVSMRRVVKYAYVYSDAKSHNCEAFFIMRGKIYFITKENDKDDFPVLFRIDRLDPSSLNTAQKIAAMNFQGVVTDAAYSSKQGILAVLTYSGIYFLRAARESDLLFAPVHFVKADFDQCEGLCFDGDYLIITNESGEIWKYALMDLLKRN